MRYEKNLDPNPWFTDDDFWYYDRLGGFVDRVVSPPFDLSLLQQGDFRFKFAASSAANQPSEVTEELRVYVSEDCGANWVLRRIVSGMELITGGNHLGSNYLPTQGDWAEESFSVNSFAGSPHVMFMFEYTAGDKSHNVFIDEIRIDGVVSVDEQSAEIGARVYPNPTRDRAILELPAGIGTTQLQVVNLTGQTVFESAVAAGTLRTEIDLRSEAGGVYFIRLTAHERHEVIRLVKH